MASKVVICGRPNVGKSTLFNCLLRNRRAIVGPTPGLTRDSIRANLPDGCLIVDTAGLASGRHGIGVEAWHKTQAEIDPETLVLMVVDAKAGLLPEDAEMAAMLRRRTLPERILVLANKAEALSSSAALGEFYKLGFKNMHAVSAAHSIGLDAVREVLAAHSAPPALIDPESSSKAERPLRIAMLGRPNVGKSTLVNRILGTSRMLMADVPGTTVDRIDLPLRWRNRELILIDAAGVRRRARVNNTIEATSACFASRAAERADVVFLIVDISEGIVHQDKELASLVARSGSSALVLLNKADLLPTGSVRQQALVLARLRLQHLRTSQVLLVSAIKKRFNGGRLLDLAIRTHQQGGLRITPARITAALQEAIRRAQPPRVGGSRPRLRFAQQVAVNPPTFLIHGRHVERLSASYRRYLANQLASHLGFANLPIKIKVAESLDNRQP